MSVVLPTQERTRLAQMSWNALRAIGITTYESLHARDPFEIYADLHRTKVSRNLNMLYALIGEREGVSRQRIARERRDEVLGRLRQMGIAPQQP